MLPEAAIESMFQSCKKKGIYAIAGLYISGRALHYDNPRLN